MAAPEPYGASPSVLTYPLISRPPDGGERPQALVTYMESLRKTRAMDLDLVLPGHGDPITDHRALIDQRFDMHARRAEKLYDLIKERSRTAHELAQALWGNIAVTQAYLDVIKPRFIGADLFAQRGIAQQILASHYHFGTANGLIALLGGIDIAAHDAMGSAPCN